MTAVALCRHCRTEIALVADYWLATGDGSATCTYEQRRAAGTAPAPDVFDLPDPQLGGLSYREAAPRTDMLLSAHQLPFMHLPEVSATLGGSPTTDQS